MMMVTEFELKKIRSEYPGFDSLTDAEKDAHIQIHRKRSMAREAEIRIKAQELDKAKIEDQYARLESDKLAREEERAKSIITPDDVGVQQTIRAQQIEDESHKWCLPFISKGFDDQFKIEAGFTILGAITGHGKTTAASAMIAHAYNFIKKGSKILLISNEQGKANYLNRISCALLNIDYQKYRQRNEKPWLLTTVEIKTITQLTIALESKIKVLAINDSTHKDLNVIENVIEVLEEVKKRPDDWSLVVIDYLQTISLSTKKGPNGGTRLPVDISHEFGNYLKKNFGEGSVVPLVLLAQLKGTGNKLHYKERVEYDFQIANHTTAFVEIQADTKNKESIFIIHKKRNLDGTADKVRTKFEKGKYIVIDEMSLAQQTEGYNLEKEAPKDA